MKQIRVGTLLLVLAIGPAGYAAEIGFVETYSLAEDRAKALEQLIPGTEGYYFYHCLEAQHAGDRTEFQRLMKLWTDRHGYTGQVKELRNRQALLDYTDHPKPSLQHIINELSLEFNHARRLPDEVPTHPTRFDPQGDLAKTLLRQAFSRYQNLKGVDDAGLAYLDHGSLNAQRRRDLLTRLTRPDLPGLPDLVVADLQAPNSGGFGSMDIHRRLTLDQLDACRTLLPSLGNETPFVQAYLTKLAPSDMEDIANDWKALRVYLNRLEAFASGLAPAHDSLKAQIQYGLLDLDRREGRYDRLRFEKYLRYPRVAPYMEREYVQDARRRGLLVNLKEDFTPFAHLKPIVQDEALIRDYLMHFFVEEADISGFQPMLSSDYLKPIFVETKIVNGIGDVEQWASMLSPDRYQALKERVDLAFALTNPVVFDDGDPVSLDLHVKNVETLLVKVFRINAFNYYQGTSRELNTAIDLDGLLATHEETARYQEAPVRRVRRTFDFPQCARPGTYVIEFIGNGVSSRAVVRKGQVRVLVKPGPAGHEFTVLDERNRHVPEATLWLDGRAHTPGEDGVILVPYSTAPATRTAILRAGDRCSLARFRHRAETYALNAAIHVDRETLVREQEARVLIRPVLTVQGHPVSSSLLEDLRLVVQTVDLDGVSSQQEVEEFALSDTGEAQHRFRVPDRITQLVVTLYAKIDNVSRGEKQDLTASQAFSLNASANSLFTEDLYFSRNGDAYDLEVLGRNGEPRPDRVVQVSVKHRFFTQPMQVPLRSDAEGRIALGPLSNVAWVKAQLEGGATRQLTPTGDRYAHPPAYHGLAGSPLRIPYTGPAPEGPVRPFSLLEVRGGVYVEDHSQGARIHDGFLELPALGAGGYELVLREDNTVLQIRLVEGEERTTTVIGKTAALEHPPAPPTHIAEVERDRDGLRIRLAHATAATRVHVFATRFAPDYDPFVGLRVATLAPAHQRFSPLRSQYVAGRNIGDEYRYVLDRRYAEIFPGTMLPRPSLLLNPWSLRKTDTEVEVAAEGDALAALDMAAPPAAPARDPSDRARQGGRPSEPTYDFLPAGSRVLVNLRPDADGMVRVPAEELEGGSQVTVVAADALTTIMRTLPLPAPDHQARDQRNVSDFKSDDHVTEQKLVTLLEPGETLRIDDVTTSSLEVFDSLADVYRLYQALNDDTHLREFSFILHWPELETAEKLDSYARHTCHELNLFLAFKDPAFFEAVIRPYLANKKDKTFVDRWLLEEDLDAYLEPWAFQRLNAVERILLARRGPGDATRVRRHVQDLVDLIPPNPEDFLHRFRTALKGQALETSDDLGFAGARTAGRQRQLNELALAGKASSAGGQVSLGRLFRGRGAAAAGAMVADAEFEAMDEQRATKAVALTAVRGTSLADNFDVSEGMNVDYFFAGRGQDREQLRRLFRQEEQTEEWAENNYYQLPIERQVADLVSANRYWRDFAIVREGDAFRSEQFLEPTANFTEMMLALAVLDLPFEDPKHETAVDGRRYSLTAGGPAIVVHQEIRPGAGAEATTPILISQQYFRSDDRYIHEGNERLDKFVTEEFLVGVPYASRVTLTNPTSSRQTLRLLLQIPTGALPLQSGFYSRGIPVTLDPYAVENVEYHFYFPGTGEFPIYPAQVAREEAFVAAAKPFTFRVVDRLSTVDTTSWDYVSQRGSDAQVLDYLDTHNPNRLDLSRIAWRMKDRRFFLRVIEHLEQRHVFAPVLWSYALHHDEPEPARTYLRHSPLAGRVGLYLESTLLSVHPEATHRYQHLEYAPLINARAHALGKGRSILNNRFHAQYDRLMHVLRYRPALTQDDILAVSYYLFLQDRQSEALAWFDRLDRDQLDETLQYDYLAVYVAMTRGDPDTARTIASARKDTSVPRWRDRFAEALAQLEEIDGATPGVVDPDNRNQQQTDLAASEPALAFEVEAREIRIDHQNLKSCRIDIYPMDVELLFSRSPFLNQDTARFAYIQPRKSFEVDLADGHRRTTIPLPPDFHSSNVMIDIVAGGLRRSQAYYANSLAVQVIETYGQLVVRAEDTRGPLPATYVKVYAQMEDGSVAFYKDGYTDLRSRFDYVSLSTDDLDRVKRFAILVLHPERGAVIREAAPPPR